LTSGLLAESYDVGIIEFECGAGEIALGLALGAVVEVDGVAIEG